LATITSQEADRLSAGAVTPSTPTVDVERLMRELEGEVRDRLRARLLEQGAASDYQDREIFAIVESVLRRAATTMSQEAILLPALLDDEDQFRLEEHLDISSHRPVVGGFIVFVKRRLILPVTRWLYEYSLDNFRRQQRVNRLVFTCLEALA